MNTIKPLPNRRNYGVRDHLSEAAWNIVEMLRLIWKQLKALPREFDRRLFADETGDKPQKPESLQDIEPIDPRSWLKRVLNRWFRPKGKGLIWHSKRRDVYSKPFEVPCHFYDEEGRWDAVPNWKWVLPCALFWIVVLVIYWLA